MFEQQQNVLAADKQLQLQFDNFSEYQERASQLWDQYYPNDNEVEILLSNLERGCNMVDVWREKRREECKWFCKKYEQNAWITLLQGNAFNGIYDTLMQYDTENVDFLFWNCLFVAKISVGSLLDEPNVQRR
eukprot:CAMPEP_0202729272 /NCGR_PEP_ID=MMETSP1385-20130828/186048_1 /ASSEMBLY_ACC=CAM_ASM_000861 /TAXON_ID=933848 /ORGANISM="Elphidium margaritaceum" /LENGTH=131 /DNA_ID=CAMNT_0049395529 /DNA_START=591 /DNA_END=983 /DNA_ORIENTATION=+